MRHVRLGRLWVRFGMMQGRRFIGYEIEPKHFATAVTRIKDALAQVDWDMLGPDLKKPEIKQENLIR